MTQREYRAALSGTVQRQAPFEVHRWFFLAPAAVPGRPRASSVPIQFTGPGTPFIMPR